MNFLSHFYFEKDSRDPNLIMGTVLPDLIKNGKKEWHFYPQKHASDFTGDAMRSLLVGWTKHIETDRLFHSSAFFKQETAQLKELLLPILDNSAVRPSFLAHISLELLLDHLLVEQGQIDVNLFYHHLNDVKDENLVMFLQKNNATDTDPFFKFLNSFKTSKYLLSYCKIENISYALQRICMRLWPHPFHEDTVASLTKSLEIYKSSLQDRYLQIFAELQRAMDGRTT